MFIANILERKKQMKHLIIIDMQNDFITGSLGTEEAVAIVPNVVEKIRQSRKNGDNLILTMDFHRNHYLETHEGRYLPIPHCIIGTDGASLHKDIGQAISDTKSSYQLIFKSAFGTFNWQKILGETLPQEDSICLVGLCSNICVITNALILRTMYPETDIEIDASCCAGETKELHSAAMEVMKSCHINVYNN